MAVPEQTPYSEYTGNGVTKSFSLGFICESKDHLIVLVDDIEPPISSWSLVGGNVVFTTAPASGKQITLQRNTPFGRTTDYQSFNNSFRPQTVNSDFDRLWLKLQELGVADWILGNRISALKNYVDRKDDELKAYLMEEIRKQGVALDQLDDYYNYLMQRLAQIAVDKGWDASFVVDGSQNQKQINLYGAKTHEPGIYPPGSKIIRDDGVIVQSIADANTTDPNTSMLNWRGFISGRRYIDVADYVSSDDTQDVYAGVKAAFAAAQGREIVFTNPYTGSRTYRFASRLNSGIIVPDGARVICEGNAVLDYSNWEKSGARRTLFKASGTQSGTTHALASDALIDTKVITLIAGGAAAYNVGDYILITSNAVFGTSNFDTQGEFARIVSKSGDALTLHEALHANYLVSNVSIVRKINFASDVAFEGMNIIGAGRFLDDSSGDSGISGEFVKGFSVSGSTIDSVDFHAISANRCLNFSITDFDITHVPTLATTGPQYGVAIIGGSMYGEISNGTSRNGQHGVAWTDIGLPGTGVSRYVDISDVHGIGQNGASFTTHTNNEHGKIIHCSSTGCAAGADIRVPNMVVDDLTVRSLRPEASTQYGIVLRSKAANLSVSGLKVFGGRFGIASIVTEPLSNPDNIKITDSDFYGQNQRAINLEHTTDTAITGLKISDNYVESDSGATVRVMMPFKNPDVRDNVVQATSSAVSASSAIQFIDCKNIIAINNTAIGYEGAVLIQSSTGTHINRGNEVLPL